MNSRLQLFEGHQSLRVDAGVVDEVVKAVGEEGGGFCHTSLDALDIVDIEFYDGELFLGVLRGKLLKLFRPRGVAGAGDNKVALVFELNIQVRRVN